MLDLTLTVPPACRADPYELEAWLAGIPAAEREVVATGVAAALGHRSLQRWKEHHAFGIGLGRPLDQFPRGTYAFFFCGEQPLPGRELLPEALEPPDLELLGAAAGLDEEEMDDMDDEELSDHIEHSLGEGILGEDGDGYFKHAEAPSLFELLRIMVAHRDLGIDPDAGGVDALWGDERLDERSAHLRPIRDLRLRRIAAELDGGGWQMERTEVPEEASSCQGVLARRPGWEFVLGWYGLPPADLGGACILCRPAAAQADEDPRLLQ